MAALPAFQLNMIAKVINAGTGEIVSGAKWVDSFTDLTPVTVQFQDGSYLIWNKDQVIFTQDVLEPVKMSFTEFVCTVEKLRDVREQEKVLKAALKGFYDKKPETKGSVKPKEAQGLPTMVDLGILSVGDVVKLRDGYYMCVETVVQNPDSLYTYPFLVNATLYKKNGHFYVTGENPSDIVQIIKKGSKLLSNAEPGDLVLAARRQDPWVIASIKKQPGNTYLVHFKHGGAGICYNNDGTAYERSYDNIILL